MSWMAPRDEKWYNEALVRAGKMMMGQPTDRINVNPLVIGHAALLHGRTLYDFYTQPTLGCELLMDTICFYRYMPMLMWIYATYWCEDFGGKIKFPVGRMSAPAIVDYPFSTPEQAEAYEVVDGDVLTKGPTMKRHWEALKACEKLLGAANNPYQFVYEMFVRAAYLVSPEKLFLWVNKRPELVHRLMKKVVEQSVIQNKLVNDKYGKVYVIASSLLASSQTLSPKQCKEFNINYLKDMADKTIKECSVTGIFYHLCGDHGQDWQLHEECPTPPGSIMHVAYDGRKSADLTKVAKVFGKRCAILGNTDTALLARGTPMQVYERVRDETLAYKNFEKGYIACCACEMPPFVTAPNVMAFMKATDDFGKLEG